MDFDFGVLVSYPFQLSKDNVDKLVEDIEINVSLEMMYI